MEVIGRKSEVLRKMPELGSASLRAAEIVDSSGVAFGDTTIFRTPVVSIDAAHREQERILPPSAAGASGQAYKMLRTQVLRRLDQLHANSLAVLSPQSGAGKTLTAVNLAIALAADPTRTALLVDLDLRRPSIATRLGIDCELGIEDCLQSHRPIQDAMIKIAGYDRLTVLPARRRVEHSSELLSDRRCGELILELRTRYANRIVIFDLPPVLQSDDALAISGHIQAGLVVVAEGMSRRAEVTRTLDLLQDLTMVGTVLNASRENISSYY